MKATRLKSQSKNFQLELKRNIWQSKNQLINFQVSWIRLTWPTSDTIVNVKLLQIQTTRSTKSDQNKKCSGGATRNFHLGAVGQGAWGTEWCPWSEAPVGCLRNEVSRSRGSLQTLFTDFDCRNDLNLKISHNWPSWFLTTNDQYVSQWGKATFLGTKPS